jgi:UDP-glucose 4-epimerase
MLLRLTNSSLRPEYREGRKVGNVQARRAAVEKAYKLLGFQAEVSLDQGLTELIRWKQETKEPQAAVAEAQ